MLKTKPWEDLISEEDAKVIQESGWGKPRGYGDKPAILVIDAQYTFVGSKDNIFDSLKENSMGIGKRAWDAVDNIKILINHARRNSIPIIYCKVKRSQPEGKFNWAMFKRYKTNEPKLENVDAMEIVEELKPQKDDLVITKQFPSAFFGTSLLSYLNTMDINTLIVTGFVTSGCIRATVNDACQYGYNTIVVGDCVADRIVISHKIELLDMDLKYADVVSIDNAIDYIENYGG